MKLYEGLKVVEFTTNIAGPTVGQWLAEYGAEVIHIERPVIGDDSRAYPPLVNGISIKYCTLNHGKKSVIRMDTKLPASSARTLISYWKAPVPVSWTDWDWGMRLCMS